MIRIRKAIVTFSGSRSWESLTTGNAQVATQAKALRPEQHSHHKADSAGNLCTSCHMPFLQHQGIGQQLVFARSDHSIPIPRPAFDQRVGIENACQKCHRDKELTWQERYVAEWYGTIKPHHRMIGNLIKAAATTDQPTAEKLLLILRRNMRWRK